MNSQVRSGQVRSSFCCSEVWHLVWRPDDFSSSLLTSLLGMDISLAPSDQIDQTKPNPTADRWDDPELSVERAVGRCVWVDSVHCYAFRHSPSRAGCWRFWSPGRWPASRLHGGRPTLWQRQWRSSAVLTMAATPRILHTHVHIHRVQEVSWVLISWCNQT